MGCFESRLDAEEALENAEKNLGFFDKPVELINTTIRKYSHKSKVNQAQLERISNQLSLTILPANICVQAFLNYLKKSDNTYSLKELLVIGILLGKGPINEKAGLLYSVFDDFLEDSIERTRITGEVLKTISRISLEAMPNLVSTDKYLFLELSQKQPKVIKSIIDRFPQSLIVISEKQFVDIMCFIENGKLLSTKGWRDYAKTVPS